MSRPQLPEARIAKPALDKLGERHTETLHEITEAIAKHPVVVVGMSQNPHVRNVRKALREAGIEFHYLEYGSYFSEWSRRLTIKMWSGWPTFPQVFVRGVLIGGEDLTKAAIADGTLRAKIDSAGEAATASA